MKDFVIIVAGGMGSRMKSDLPKQFLTLKGKPVMLHTLEKFHRFHAGLGIIVVLPGEYVSFWKELVATLQVTIPHTVVSGGSERFFSVKKGLAAITEENGIVGIHDAVRPLVSLKTIEACYSAARTRSNAIPVIEIHDAVRMIDETGHHPVDRHHFRIVQTPQCFELSLLREAYEQPFLPAFTDDATVVEHAGQPLFLIEGNRENFKITTPADLRMASFLIG